MKGLNLKNIAAAVDGKLYNGENDDGCEIDGVVIDSRKIEKNYLFVAIKGERVDGHDFIPQVFEKGARVAISEKKLETEKPYILVKSSTEALKHAQRNLLHQFYLKSIMYLKPREILITRLDFRLRYLT